MNGEGVDMLTETDRNIIDSLSQMEMASMHRYAPIGHRFFKDDPTGEYFSKVFGEKGGMTPSVSKSID